MSSLSKTRANRGVPHDSLRTAKAIVRLFICLLAATLTAHANLPPWLQHTPSATTLESAIYRLMTLPVGADVSYPRPPREAAAELAKLPPDTAGLYPLRARTDEAALDFTAAEADWKAAIVHAKDPVAARLDLANFYQRRLRTTDEIATLREVAAAPSPATERFIDPSQQRSYQAYLRILSLITEQDLAATESAATYDAFLTRYAAEPAVFARAFEWQLTQQNYPAAASLIARYKQAFPQDPIFPIRAQALLEYHRGNIDAALAVYDQSFQPLWPSSLVQSYFALLTETHHQRLFLADARRRLAQQPDGPAAINALARIFYYQQQQNRLDQAQQELDAFRVAREARNAAWSASDLHTLATLSASIHNYAEAARYNYALASLPGNLPGNLQEADQPAAQAGLSGLADLLLTAPDEPITLGAGNLTLYRDIATLDQGPGYWNGILSLWLNGTSPQTEYDAETAKAQTYFHRSKAAELIAQLDSRFPAAPQRAGLHAALVRTYSSYGESTAVIDSGKQYLAAFPQAADRVEIAGLIADAYQRQNDTTSEFALYDSELDELAAKTSGQPLSAATATAATRRNGYLPSATPSSLVRISDNGDQSDAEEAVPARKSTAYSLDDYTTHAPDNQSAEDYKQVLDRYLGRLVQTGHIPQALTVMRHQLDRNPDDPALYERLAAFLSQNNLSAAEEQAYKQALAHFSDRTWYSKLAGLYLRQKRTREFDALTRQVTGIFSGTELESWFSQQVKTADPIGPQLALQLNLYAANRFPHDLVFSENLLRAYQTRPTQNAAAYEALLRRHWFESPPLRDEFFAYLSRNNKLQAELAALNTSEGAPPLASEMWVPPNPAATRELAEALTWTSHFEQAAPLLGSIATLYPADLDTGDRASSLYRSLSYLDPTKASLNRAAAIETSLLAATPADADRLATLGDLYAEATSTGGEDLTTATPYWRRIPAIHPGTPAGYLTSATIFWDYFQFDDALAQITQARTRFHQPNLYGYEAGAIQENRHDMAAAVAEYTADAVAPPELPQSFQSFVAVAQAYFRPPSDAADSNFRSTAQSFFNSEHAHQRLMQLANRTATRSLVDTASAQALAKSPTDPQTLTLRADVLTAQHRQPELAPLLTSAVDHARTADEVASIGTLAQAHALTPVYEQALTRQATLTADPVEKIQLEYTLARSLEGRKQTAAATRVIDTVYRANPRILGVVRATTDYYARNDQPKPAIATLLEASKAATPGLSRTFTLEAAQRANDSGDTTQARNLALTLLPATPYDATVLATISTSYAQSNDNAGLKTFYLAQLDHARSDPTLTPNDRKQKIAMLRRGLIPALTQLNDFDGAEAQYIAILSAFPEDSPTAQEAALYALRHQRQPQLLGFLNTTVQQSPKDSRFAILLAQVQTTFEDLPAAVAAYNSAIAVRKDRADLYQARSDLELRLGLTDPARLEAAAADFNRLYLLTYKDPQWMVRLAELRARQQRATDAVKALTTAYIDNQPKKANNYFTVAAQLERWNLLPEARTFTQQGMALAGASLFTSNDSTQGATTYARVLTRMGKPDEALKTLTALRKTSDASIKFPAAQLAELTASGAEPADIASQRDNYIQQRQQMAKSQLQQALSTIGTLVAQNDTPEQKLAYAQTLDTLHTTDPDLALDAAASAGLADREADWRKQRLLASNPAEATGLAPYAALEQRRLAFTDLAQTLEAQAARVPPAERNNLRQQAADSWHSAATAEALASQLRLVRLLAQSGSYSSPDRNLALLLHRDPAAFNADAARNTPTGEAALNFALSQGAFAQATAALRAHGRALSPLWTDASYALTGLFFNQSSVAAVHAAFARILRADSPIADRIAHPSDPKLVLTGDNWFFYAARFGIGLPADTAEDFLPAALEHSPSDPAAYTDLARTYSEASNHPAAIAELRHALELTPRSVTLSDALALELDRSGNHAEAVAQWRAAFALLRRDVEINAFPDEFYTGFNSVMRHLAARKLTAEFHPEIEAVVRPYFAKNGNYRSNEFLEVVYTASATPAEGAAFLTSLANSATEPETILSDLSSAVWLDPEARIAILQRRIELIQSTPAADSTYDPPAARIRRIQIKLADLYLAQRDYPKAQALLDSMPTPKASTKPLSTDYDEPQSPVTCNAAEESSQPDTAQWRLRLLLAARTNRLAALLQSFRATPDQAPAASAIEGCANLLATAKPNQPADFADARLLREYVFEQKQLAHTLIPTDFLALAQLRIDTNDLPGALELLRRLTLQPSATNPGAPGLASETWAGAAANPEVDANPYTNTASAASLLEETHHPAEAIPFLESLVQSVPWNADYRLRLAQAQIASGDKERAILLLLQAIADPLSPYDTRVTAAKALHGVASDVNPQIANLTSAQFNPGEFDRARLQFGSAELVLLAFSSIQPQQARQPYFVESRIVAAASTSVAKPDRQALLHEAIAANPSSPSADQARVDLLLLADESTPAPQIIALAQAAAITAPAQSLNASEDTIGDTATDASTADDTTDTSADTENSMTGVGAPPPIPSATLPPIANTLNQPTRIRLALLIAAAWQREQDDPAAPTQALHYLQLAVTLDAVNPHPDPQLTRRRDDLNAAIQLAAANAARQPALHKDLDQPNDVRPKLTLSNIGAP